MTPVFNEHEHVAIFWDYENCSPPSTTPGYDITNNIREIAHRFGSVKQFKAYLELSDQSSAKSLNLRSELQSCGVSLTDCPHNGRKDVADKMMIVDMLTYALDTPAPATLLLITGDRDFVYAVSVLRLRRYRVVLVAPTATHASLKSQASEVVDWECDVLGKTSRYTRSSIDDPGLPNSVPVIDTHRRARSTSVLIGSTSPSCPRQPRRPSMKESLGGMTSTNDSERGSLTTVDRGTSPGFPLSAVGETATRSAPRTPVRSTPRLPVIVTEPPKVREIHEAIVEDVEPLLDINVHLKNLQQQSFDASSPHRLTVSTPSTPCKPSRNEVAAVSQRAADVPMNDARVKGATINTSPHALGPSTPPSSIPPPSGGTPTHTLNQVQEIPDEQPAEETIPGSWATYESASSVVDCVPIRAQSTPPLGAEDSNSDLESLVSESGSISSLPTLSSPYWSISAAKPSTAQVTLSSYHTSMAHTQESDLYIAKAVSSIPCPKPTAAGLSGVAAASATTSNLSPRPVSSQPAASEAAASADLSVSSGMNKVASSPQVKAPPLASLASISATDLQTGSSSRPIAAQCSSQPPDSESSHPPSGQAPSAINNPVSPQPGTSKAGPPFVVPAVVPTIPPATDTPIPSGCHSVTQRPISITVSPPVPQHYNVLLVVLERCRMVGVLQPLRHNIAPTLMKENQNTYKLAGYKTFKQYTTEAQKRGIVVLGGSGGAAWIQLSPEWYGRAVGV